ncbi:hypothetical protein C8J56DRAFT_597352 [Mycena floridula]|nr:hypothetical protein C8J56DRAFT_597352 [Mycena floridula]
MIMTFLAAGILAVFGIAYLSATIAPLIDTASPIRTPLTTLVLQFSFTRNWLRKTSLCGMKVASFMQSRARAGTLACWKPVTKYYSIVGDIGRALMKRLSKWTTQSRLLFSQKIEPDIRPSSEMEEYSSPPWILPNIAVQPTQQSAMTLPKWLEPFVEIWSDNTLCTSDLDTIKESTALNDSLTWFYQREITSLSWTLEHTTNDGELVLFLEGIPIYLNSDWSDLHFGKPAVPFFDHSPAHVLRTVLQHPESTFLSKLETFVSIRTLSMSERDASAVVNALSSLFEKEIHLYTEATRFLDDYYSSIHLRWFLERSIGLYLSLSPAIRRLQVIAVLRCAQARGSKYKTTYNDQYSWPFSNVGVPVGSFRYSELRPFWDAIKSFLGSEWEFNGMGTAPTRARAAAAAEENQGITLFSLCIFFWEGVRNPQGHFTDSFVAMVVEDLIRYVSPLVEGSAGAQQAYSAGVFLITSALEEVSPELKRRDLYNSMARVVSKFLDPLVRITDDAAAETAQKVLCSPGWSTRLLKSIPVSWLGNPVCSQIMYANEIARYLRPWPSPWPSIPEKVTLAGMHSTMQIEFVQPLNSWLTEIPPDGVQHIPSLFRLLGTLDEPKAVIEVQQALRDFLTLPQPESNLDAARKALGQLEMTASKPEFIYKALASVSDYP